METGLLVMILHLFGAMAWVGSLIFVAVVLFPYLRREFGDEEYRDISVRVGLRFQALGWVSIAVLGVTGALNVYLRFGTLAPPLLGSGYGTVLAAKVGMYVLLVAFTLYHSWASMRSDGRRGSGPVAYAMVLLTVGIVVTAVLLGSTYGV